MTPQAQCIAIAEACDISTEAFRFWYMSHGGTEWKESPHYRTMRQAEEAMEGESHWSECKAVESVRSHHNVPSYLTDLNAMHRAEQTLRDIDRRAYRSILAENTDLFDADAQTKAEAFLRALDLWDDLK
jgi:hypothetical protein